jgi:hypothetical protein
MPLSPFAKKGSNVEKGRHSDVTAGPIVRQGDLETRTPVAGAGMVKRSGIGCISTPPLLRQFVREGEAPAEPRTAKTASQERRPPSLPLVPRNKTSPCRRFSGACYHPRLGPWSEARAASSCTPSPIYDGTIGST